MAVIGEERLSQVVAGPAPGAVAAGRDVLAALARRGITVRLGEEGRLWAGPAELIDETDRALLTEHREDVVAALRTAAGGSQQPPADAVGPDADGEHRRAVHIVVPGRDASLLDEIAAVLVRHPGQNEVLLHFEVDGWEVAVQAGERFRVEAGPALQADLEACLRQSGLIDAAGPAVAAASQTLPAPDLHLVPTGPAEEEPRVVAGAQTIDVDRVLVTESSEWERVKADLLAEPLLGLDTEATGLDPFTSRLRLVQLAARGRAYLVDVFRLDPHALQPVLDRAGRLVGHNLKFDLRMLMAAGLRLPTDLGRRVSDTMLAGLLLGAGVQGERHRLADLVQRYLGVTLDKTEQVSDWSGDLTADQLAYAARDAAVLLPLRDHLRADLERADLGRVALIESRALPAMAWLEQTGAPFDQAAWLALAEIAERRRRGLERELDALAPSDSLALPLAGLEEVSTRWSSPAQVLNLLESRGVMLLDTRELLRQGVPALRASGHRPRSRRLLPVGLCKRSCVLSRTEPPADPAHRGVPRLLPRAGGPGPGRCGLFADRAPDCGRDQRRGAPACCLPGAARRLPAGGVRAGRGTRRGQDDRAGRALRARRSRPGAQAEGGRRHRDGRGAGALLPGRVLRRLPGARPLAQRSSR
ncbi:MAG: hypothetical protein E6J41_28360 [Chloroflexi bacterium]|nr:MAG: hypothetical protein E6J41_28360 [Chloroflexota bacterium]